MKYIMIVIDGKRKRALTCEDKSDSDVRKRIEKLLLCNHWKRGELYKHDSYTSNMDDSYLLQASAVKSDRFVEWIETDGR